MTPPSSVPPLACAEEHESLLSYEAWLSSTYHVGAKTKALLRPSLSRAFAEVAPLNRATLVSMPGEGKTTLLGLLALRAAYEVLTLPRSFSARLGESGCTTYILVSRLVLTVAQELANQAQYFDALTVQDTKGKLAFLNRFGVSVRIVGIESLSAREWLGTNPRAVLFDALLPRDVERELATRQRARFHASESFLGVSVVPSCRMVDTANVSPHYIDVIAR